MGSRSAIPVKYMFDSSANIVALSEYMPGDLIPPEFLGLLYLLDGGAITDIYRSAFSVDGGKITDVYQFNNISYEGGPV